jgi:hypothetical protein
MMKKHLLLFLCLAFIGIVNLSAQIWNTAPVAVQYPSNGVRDTLTNELDTMSVDKLDSLNRSRVMDSLLLTLERGINPFNEGATSTIWGFALDTLRLRLGNSVANGFFNGADTSSIINQFGNINTSWFTNINNLINGFGNVGIPPYLPIRDTVHTTNTFRSDTTAIKGDLNNALSANPSTGFTGNTTTLLNDLFNPANFKIILYGGVQDVNYLRYYDLLAGNFTNTVVGVRSDRDFRQPWTRSWDIWGSFNTQPIEFDDGETPGVILFGNSNFNPFELGGNYTVYKTFGGSGLRLITGVGFGAHTYAPVHQGIKGFTTACTAEVSGGMFFRMLPTVNVYAMATVGSGPVAESIYHYKGTRYEAGTHFGRYSLRYTIMDGIWQNDRFKESRTHMIVVGYLIN